MNYKKLAEKDISVVPVGDLWNVDPERLLLVYAPLNRYISACLECAEELFLLFVINNTFSTVLKFMD